MNHTELKNCQRCPIAATRKQVVCGRGSGKVMLVGEAPRAEEDATGLPFVGQSGKLLTQLLTQLGLADKVYITNAVKCRPPNNRPPTVNEIRACSYWLNQEMRERYQYNVAMGRTAQRAMGFEGVAFGSLINNGERTLVAVWHPSYVLRNRWLYEKWKAQWAPAVKWAND